MAEKVVARHARWDDHSYEQVVGSRRVQAPGAVLTPLSARQGNLRIPKPELEAELKHGYSSRMLKHLHAQPMQVHSHDYDGDRQGHKQAISLMVPVVLNGEQEPVVARREGLGPDGDVEEAGEERDAERDEGGPHYKVRRERHGSGRSIYLNLKEQ
ncbi:uncharacterized protein [Aegilops tauschii subsp. strangulata]|uniref:uncharacterized protein n=1 Tax=Aegilops tauschii subsp. strangulata TaxID=200361 RepID=UPI00098A0E90